MLPGLTASTKVTGPRPGSTATLAEVCPVTVRLVPEVTLPDPSRWYSLTELEEPAAGTESGTAQ